MLKYHRMAVYYATFVSMGKDSKSIVSCSTGDTSLCNFYIMTLPVYNVDPSVYVFETSFVPLRTLGPPHTLKLKFDHL